MLHSGNVPLFFGQTRGGRMVSEKKQIKKGGGKLLSGVLVLTVANLLVKVLGFVYKVPLNAFLGDEMAGVNAAYAIYALLYTASTAGIPGAVALSVSRSVASGDKRRVKLIFYSSLVCLLSLGLLLFALLALFARPIAQMNSDGDAYLCILAISPALFFTAAASVFRGYFQGFSEMTPTAVSQFVEALGKAVLGLGFVFLSLNVWGQSRPTAAALSVFGITLGVAVSAAYLAIAFWRRGRGLWEGIEEKARTAERGRAVFRSVFIIALPITLTSAMMSLSTLLDAQMMRPLLTRYYSDAALAKSIYSDYSTGAVTLYNLPAILITPLCTAMIPYVSAALARGEKQSARRSMEAALSATALLSLPCALGMSALSSPILTFVFRGDENMAENAGILLSVLALSVFFLALLMVTSSALQAVGKERLPILSLAVGIGVKLLTMPLLTHLLGKTGVPLSTLFFFIAVCTLNFYFVRRETGVRVRLTDTFFKPALCALLSALTALFVYRPIADLVSEDVSLLLSILLAAFVYAFALLFTRAVSRSLVEKLPFGGRILSRFGRFFAP